MPCRGRPPCPTKQNSYADVEQLRIRSKRRRGRLRCLPYGGRALLLAMGHQPHTLGTMSKAITMSTTKSAPKPSASPTEKVLEAKWGKTLIAAGFTALPDVIFQYQKALKLKPLDVLVLLHLASYWWKPNENPWPAKGTIADAIDVDPRTVQRSIAKMEALGYVQRIERKAKAGDNLTNQYDLRGLVKAAATFAEQKIAIREKRAGEDKSRRATPAAFALIEGGKKI